MSGMVMSSQDNLRLKLLDCTQGFGAVSGLATTSTASTISSKARILHER
jgi:hypothetical protein